MRPAIAIRLSAAEARSLRRLQARSKSGRVWARISAILMLAAGLSAAKVHCALSVSRVTLTRWKKRWIKGRQFRLADAPRSGRPPRVTPKYIHEMTRVVQQDPRRLGYAFRRWTAPRLAEYLAHKTGIRVTDDWLAELLRTHGFVWRKTKRTLRNLQDPAAAKHAQKQLKRLKRGSWILAPTTSSGSAMGFASSFFPSRRIPGVSAGGR